MVQFNIDNIGMPMTPLSSRLTIFKLVNSQTSMNSKKEVLGTAPKYSSSFRLRDLI